MLRSDRREPPDLTKLARALLAVALADQQRQEQAATQATGEHNPNG